MKRVFKFKKGEITDWDEDMIHFLEEYLCNEGQPENNYFPKFRKNWKVTIKIEEIKE
jgi:hypothetical protein